MDELSELKSEGFMAEITDMIKDICPDDDYEICQINESTALTEKLKDINMEDRRNWSKLQTIMISAEGKIVGYYLRSLMEDFKERSKPGLSSYDLVYQILFIDEDWHKPKN